MKRHHDTPVSPNFANGHSGVVSVYPFSCLTREGRLVITYRNGSAKHSRDGVLVSQYSDDAGTTWSSRVTLFNGIAKTESVHTGVVYQRPDGIVEALVQTVEATDPESYIFSEQGRSLRQFHHRIASADGGVTWSAPQKLGIPAMPLLAYFGSRPFVCADGTVLLAIESTEPAGVQSIYISRSTDSGVSFEPPAAIALDASGELSFGDARLVELGSGVLVAYLWTWTTQSEKTIALHRCVTRNSGITWTEPEPVALTAQVTAPARTQGDNLLAAANIRAGHQGIRLVASSDDGLTWNNPLQLWDPYQNRITLESCEIRDEHSAAEAATIWSALPAFTFGSPELHTRADGSLLMTYYAIVDGVTHVRCCQFAS